MFKLGKLTVDNFKSISKEVVLDFCDLDVVILDGPNGFGKTTLFDAIEISFTGGMSRIDAAGGSADSKAKSNHLLKNAADRRTEIILELNDTASDEVYFIRSVIVENIKGAKASIKDYKINIERSYRRSSFLNDEWLPLNNSFVERLIGLDSISDLFYIQHYIQQEETAGFLKDNSEGSRHKQLSHLFGTVSQSNELLKIERLRKIIDLKVKTHKDSIGVIDAQLKTIKPLETDPNEGVLHPSGVLRLPDTFSTKGLTAAGYSALVENLNILLFCVKKPEAYEELKSSNRIDQLLQGRDQQLNDILRLGMVNDYSKINRLHRTRAKHQRLQARLNRLQNIVDAFESDNQNLGVAFLDLISREFPPADLINIRLIDLQNERAHNKGIKALLVSMASSRKSLIDAYQKILEEESHSIVSCPLCGAVKESGLPQLIEEIESHQKIVMEQASGGVFAIANLKGYIFENYIASTVARCKVMLEKYKKFSNNSIISFFDQKAIDLDRFSDFKKVQNWLDGQSIDYASLVDGKVTDFSLSYTERFIKFKSMIGQLKNPIEGDVPPFSVIRNALRYFELGEDAIRSITEEDLLKDLRFITSVERNHTNSIVGVSMQKRRLLSRKIENLIVEKNKLSTISTVYKQEIQKHESNIAAQIAIPFYIYSSKVLQTRPEGTGIFLRTPDANKKETVPYIRFCSSKYDEHDAWYTMSSGQLSGLIISFALSMNKIYPSKLKALLIDDPVQSMDEVNMASLIQLLKYEFGGHQLILSTHDSRVSSYVNYKLHRAGKAVERINMKSISKDFN